MAYEQFETAGIGAMNLGSEAMSRFQTASDMGGFRATKDIELERREQERLQLAQADRQREMMEAAQNKQRKRESAKGWGSLIGGAIGSVVPGVGTAIGAAGGAALGSMFGQEGGQVPRGKFLQGGWENLQRRSDYLSDQQKAINLAMKPTLGSVLSAGVQGYQTGKAFSDFAKSEQGQKLIGAGGSLLDWTKGKATDLIHGRMDVSEGGARTMYKPGLLDLLGGAKELIGAGIDEAGYQAGQAFENIETRAKGGVSAMIDRLRGPKDVETASGQTQGVSEDSWMGIKELMLENAGINPETFERDPSLEGKYWEPRNPNETPSQRLGREIYEANKAHSPGMGQWGEIPTPSVPSRPSFGQAFRTARQAGKGTFTWGPENKLFTTEIR